MHIQRQTLKHTHETHRERQKEVNFKPIIGAHPVLLPPPHSLFWHQDVGVCLQTFLNLFRLKDCSQMKNEVPVLTLFNQ